MKCLLHGFTQTPASWQPVIECLPEDGTPLLRPSLLGHGDAGANSFDGEVDRIAAMWSEPVDLVGYSLGARVALGVVVRHPEKVRSACLIGVHPGLRDEVERAQRRAADERWAQLLEREGIAEFVRRWEAMPLFAMQRGLPSALLCAQREQRLTHDPAGLAKSLRVLGLGEMPSRWLEIEKSAVPMLLVVGEHDLKFRALAAEVISTNPRLTLHVVADAGHNVLLAEPREIAACVSEFQRRVASRELQ